MNESSLRPASSGSHFLRHPFGVLFFLGLVIGSASGYARSLSAQPKMGLASGISYSLWNGYRGQFNILECSSASSVSTEFSVRLHSSNGDTLTNEPLVVPAEGSAHLVLNSIAKLQNAYGLLALLPIEASKDQSHRVNCALMQYGDGYFTTNSEVVGQGSVVALSLRGAFQGSRSFPFNTLSPFSDISRVQNWLSVFNADSEHRGYTIEQYDLNGALLDRERIESLAPFARYDLEIGGFSTVGLLRVVPDRVDAEYGASLMRYGMRSGDTRFAVELAELENLEESATYPLSTAGPSLNWMELFNNGSDSVTFSLSFKVDSSESTIEREYELPGNSVRHINAGLLVGENSHASFSIDYAEAGGSVGLASMHYGRSSSWAYQSHAPKPLQPGAAEMSLYNTYLGAANWLRIIAEGTSTAPSSVLDFPELSISLELPPLNAGDVRDIPLHERTGVDRFGYSLRSRGSGIRSSSALRVFYDPDASISTVTSIAPMSVAQSVSSVELNPLIRGLSAPVHLTHAGDGSERMFVVERAGVIKVIRDGLVLADPYLDISTMVGSDGEQGLHSLAFDPSFSRNGLLYVHYNDLNGDSIIAELRASNATDDQVSSATHKIVLRVEQPHVWHNGGQIAFGPDGFLYIGLGDGGFGGDPLGHGQNTNTLLGSILRISVSDGTYSIPVDNPFANSEDGAAEIYAYGFRNPWRFSFDRLTGRLFTADVGQNQLEEIDLVKNGGNYGWNTMEGSICFVEDCSKEGLELPIAEYPHQEGLAVIGGFVYRGKRFPQLWGAYLFADFSSARIWSLHEDHLGVWHRKELFVSDEGLLFSSFGEDEQGEIYLVDLRGTIWALDVS
jgi:glucose/arabinose dehydrogenase